MQSVASRIRAALIERAKRINGAGGFIANIGGRVFDERAYIDQLAELPASALPAVFLFRGRGSGQRSGSPNSQLQLREVRWTALLVAARDPLRTQGQQVEDQIADLERAFEVADDPLIEHEGAAQLARVLSVEQSDHGLDQDVAGRCYAAVDIVTVYPAVYGDPAAHP